jgi:hypothetical protein
VAAVVVETAIAGREVEAAEFFSFGVSPQPASQSAAGIKHQ